MTGSKNYTEAYLESCQTSMMKFFCSNTSNCDYFHIGFIIDIWNVHKYSWSYSEKLQHKVQNIIFSLFLCTAEYGNNHIQGGIYLFKVNNENTRKICQICLKLTIKRLERHQGRRYSALNTNIEQISHIFLAYAVLNSNREMPTDIIFVLSLQARNVLTRKDSSLCFFIFVNHWEFSDD